MSVIKPHLYSKPITNRVQQSILTNAVCIRVYKIYVNTFFSGISHNFQVLIRKKKQSYKVVQQNGSSNSHAVRCIQQGAIHKSDSTKRKEKKGECEVEYAKLKI